LKNWWFIKGIKRGVITEKETKEMAEWSTEIQGSGKVDCPTRAIENGNWNAKKCVFCRRCYPSYKPNMNPYISTVAKTEKLFKRSFYLFVVDSGTCGGCNLELKLIASPQYDMTRFGIFFTNTPRHADALVIMGVLTEKMKEVIKEAYDAMPEPKLVILLGACAISGGVIGNGIPVEATVIIPGCPPNPVTILDALRRVKA